jgi:hypothetical protein
MTRSEERKYAFKNRQKSNLANGSRYAFHPIGIPLIMKIPLEVVETARSAAGQLTPGAPFRHTARVDRAQPSPGGRLSLSTAYYTV